MKNEKNQPPSPEDMPPTQRRRLYATIAAILLFTSVFIALRYLEIIDELPLKMGIFEGFFK
jgi:hypothetical protein